MTNITITCSSCGTPFEKRKAEYTRRLKSNPDYKFFCNLSCYGKATASRLDAFSFANNPDAQRSATLLGKGKNRIYYGDDIYFATILRKCKGRNKEFNLTLEFLRVLWEKQHGVCAISNIPLQLGSTSWVDMPSIDRIDSNLGYVEGNVQFVSTSINLAKSNMSNDEAIRLITLICESNTRR